MNTAEEILLDELNSIQATYLDEIPNFKQWVISAMEIYANQAVNNALKDIHLLLNPDNKHNTKGNE